MNHTLNNRSPRLLLLAAILILGPSLTAFARYQDPDVPQQPESQRPVDDPIRALEPSPEQREKIRTILESNREERMAINRRLRQAQLALEETLDGDNPSEAAVEQRIRDLAEAHAAQIRMRSLTELRIRQVLTPEQLRRWRELRQAQHNQRRPSEDGEARRPVQRNGIGPMSQRDRRGMFPAKPRP